MAMAGAVLGLRVPDLVLENVGTTAKTLPQFTRRWTQMLAGGGDGSGRGSADATGGA
jgi:3-phosphoshikimate 1-carboxyvinyltransferase